ncbi:hypothetical protein Thiosp_04907 [Thiorhodovibrio litoralis]|nr:hypothetical protein Thiosp_04907 [Thiorhodovibrio litoralis]
MLMSAFLLITNILSSMLAGFLLELFMLLWRRRRSRVSIVIQADTILIIIDTRP